MVMVVFMKFSKKIQKKSAQQFEMKFKTSEVKNEVITTVAKYKAKQSWSVLS